MSKKSPKPIAPVRPLSRRSARNEPLPVFFIFSEGSITEPEYLNAFYRDICTVRKIALSPIFGGAGVPMTLVEKCIEKKLELKRSERENSFEKNSCVWAVFDVDEHPRFDEAVALAKQNGIRCAISNPCVEVWGLMHLSAYERPSSRHEAQAELAKVMPGYHHDKSPIFPWHLCRDNIDKAIDNSAAVIKRREDEGQKFPKGNPTTSFHELLIALKGDINPTDGRDIPATDTVDVGNNVAPVVTKKCR